MCLGFALLATVVFVFLVSLAFVTVYQRDEISFVTLGDWGKSIGMYLH